MNNLALAQLNKRAGLGSLVAFGCRRCLGGQVLYEHGEFKCLQCGCEYNEKGEILTLTQKDIIGYKGGWHFAETKTGKKGRPKGGNHG